MAIRGIFISIEVMQDENLNQSQKFLLSEIEQLTSLEKGCIATNKHFAKLIGITSENVSKNMSDLVKKDYISIELKKGTRNHFRKISLIKMIRPPYQNDKTPLSKRQESKERKTIEVSTTISKKLKSNQYLIDTISMQNKNIDVLAKIDEFERFCLSVKKIHSNDSEIYNHFMSWIRQNKINRNRDVDKELEWFIKMFNKVSKGNFKATNEVEVLFIKQLNNGFTGKEMAIAVKHLFSSDDKNDWHKKTGYKFANPIHLLKDDNVNVYLNQRF